MSSTRTAIPAAHVVGVSAGGGIAQQLALAQPDRVRSLVLISTSPATPGERDLPSPTERFNDFLASADVDWSDQESVIEYLVGYARMLAGGERPFDEAAWRELVQPRRRAGARHRASENHGLVAEGDVPAAPISSIAAPTLVIHGTADPMFPLEHGRALAEEIPGARLLTLEGAGHGVERADWDAIVPRDPRAHCRRGAAARRVTGSTGRPHPPRARAAVVPQPAGVPAATLRTARTMPS